MTQPNQLVVKYLGLVDYEQTAEKMAQFTQQRLPDTADEIWLLQHPPVYTQGQAGKAEHILRPTNIPVVQANRGGQVTYHGPGQLVVYLLLDIRRKQLNVRELVELIEQSVIDLLADYEVVAASDKQAPGVYVDGAKVAALGLRVSRGCTYHGLSLNIKMDLAPFNNINPCGYQGLAVTDMDQLGIKASFDEVTEQLKAHLLANFGYDASPS